MLDADAARTEHAGRQFAAALEADDVCVFLRNLPPVFAERAYSRPACTSNLSIRVYASYPYPTGFIVLF